MHKLVLRVRLEHHIPLERMLVDANEYGECMISTPNLMILATDIYEEEDYCPQFLYDWCLDVLAGITKPSNEMEV